MEDKVEFDEIDQEYEQWLDELNLNLSDFIHSHVIETSIDVETKLS
jgi:hypothetical protein